MSLSCVRAHCAAAACFCLQKPSPHQQDYSACKSSGRLALHFLSDVLWQQPRLLQLVPLSRHRSTKISPHNISLLLLNSVPIKMLKDLQTLLLPISTKWISRSFASSGVHSKKQIQTTYRCCSTTACHANCSTALHLPLNLNHRKVHVRTQNATAARSPPVAFYRNRLGSYGSRTQPAESTF